MESGMGRCAGREEEELPYQKSRGLHFQPWEKGPTGRVGGSLYSRDLKQRFK
jgi:hypothetical protein